ncbi:MAG: hypothetical protein MUE41_08500 [Gemmatimonadaceae bacterium]|nr:hypothetical protein [Gemmatimonadaceae bacterium]
MRPRFLCVPALVALTACADAITFGEPSTTLVATVVRGPVVPVCRVDEVCEDAPFVSGFDIERGGVRVATVRSDTAGRFRVALAPGEYRVVPQPDAPIIFPRSQVKLVRVTTDSVTRVRLQFDTGIR